MFFLFGNIIERDHGKISADRFRMRNADKVHFCAVLSFVLQDIQLMFAKNAV